MEDVKNDQQPQPTSEASYSSYQVGIQNTSTEEAITIPFLPSTSTTNDSQQQQQQQHPNRARRIETGLFFISAIGTTLGWTAVLSNLVYYTINLGKESYVFLNLAVFVPLLPVSWAQAIWDSHFDRQFRSSLFTFNIRGAIGYAFTIVTLLLIPVASNNLLALSALTFLLGTASAVTSGMLRQMASFIYPGCGTLAAAVTAGMQAPAALVLLVSEAAGFGKTGESKGIVLFYFFIALIVGLCWVSFQFLMSHSRDVLRSMSRRDSSLGVLDEPLLDDDDEEENTDTTNNQQDVNDLTEDELTFEELWKKTWRNCAAIMMTVASSMSVSSWFNRVQSADPTDLSLPRVLFYVRLFSDLFGRPSTLLLKPTSANCIGFFAIVRLLFVPLFFIYTSANESILPRSDAAVIGGIALFAFSSGYIATACYQLAPDTLVEGQRASMPKQASLINVCFSAAVLSGVVIALLLQGLGL